MIGEDQKEARPEDPGVPHGGAELRPAHSVAQDLEAIFGRAPAAAAAVPVAEPLVGPLARRRREIAAGLATIVLAAAVALGWPALREAARPTPAPAPVDHILLPLPPEVAALPPAAGPVVPKPQNVVAANAPRVTPDAASRRDIRGAASATEPRTADGDVRASPALVPARAAAPRAAAPRAVDDADDRSPATRGVCAGLGLVARHECLLDALDDADGRLRNAYSRAVSDGVPRYRLIDIRARWMRLRRMAPRRPAEVVSGYFALADELDTAAAR